MAFTDPTLSEINTLDPVFAPYAFQFINALRTYGIPAWIQPPYGARRTLAQETALVGRGASETLHSAHLQGLAFDIDILGYGRDQIPAWWWNALGGWAEANFPFKWGGRWKTLKDYAHFQANWF